MSEIQKTAIAVASAFQQDEDDLMVEVLAGLERVDLILVAAQLAGFFVKSAEAHARSVGLPEQEYATALLQTLGADFAAASP